MMVDALDAAFGTMIRDALQPVVERLTDLQTQVTALTMQIETLTVTQASLVEMGEAMRNGKGMLAKFLNGG